MHVGEKAQRVFAAVCLAVLLGFFLAGIMLGWVVWG